MLTSPGVIIDTPGKPRPLMEGNQFRLSSASPLLCVDGYLFACQYDGDACTPVFGIKVEDLLTAISHELRAFTQSSNELDLQTSSAQTTPSKSDLEFSFQSPSSSNRAKRRSASVTFRKTSRERIRRRLYSDQDDYLGISYDSLEHPLRNSFLVPMVEKDNDVNTDDLNANISTESVEPRSLNTRTAEYQQLLGWVEQNSNDYINADTVTSISDLGSLLQALLKCSMAVVVTIKINHEQEMIVTYQFMQKFKQDYMVVRINNSYAMLMKAF